MMYPTHPIATMIKEELVAPYLDEDGGEKYLSPRPRCERKNYTYYDKLTFTIWSNLNDTPYTTGETDLAGWNSLKQNEHSIQTYFDIAGFTPVKELPAPADFLIEEAEREEAKYCGELLSKVLTIPEARGIRQVLLKKLNCHPIAQGIHDEVEKFRKQQKERRQITYVTDERAMAEFFRTNPRMYPRYSHPPRYAPIIDYYLENYCKYTRGKKKGEYNRKSVDLLWEIDAWWRQLSTQPRQFCLAFDDETTRYITRDSYLRCGYAKYFEANWKKWKYKNKGDWDCGMLPMWCKEFEPTYIDHIQNRIRQNENLN